MHSNQSSPTVPQSSQPKGEALLRWNNLINLYGEIAENPQTRPRLTEEMSYGGLGTNPDSLQNLLMDVDPTKAIKRYFQVNPEIKLSQVARPEKLTLEEKYNLVAGLVKMYDNS